MGKQRAGVDEIYTGRVNVNSGNPGLIERAPLLDAWRQRTRLAKQTWPHKRCAALIDGFTLTNTDDQGSGDFIYHRISGEQRITTV